MSRKAEKIKVGFPRSGRIQVSFTSGLFSGTPLVPKRRTRDTQNGPETSRKLNREIHPVKVTVETSDGGYLASSSSSEGSGDEVSGVAGRFTSDESMEVETSGSEGEAKKTTTKISKVCEKKGKQCLKMQKNGHVCLKDYDKTDGVCLNKKDKKGDNTVCLKIGQKRKMVGDTSEGDDADTESSAGSTEPRNKSSKAKKAKKKTSSKTNGTQEAVESDTTEAIAVKSSDAETNRAAESTDVEETTNKGKEVGSAVSHQSGGNGNWTASQDSIIISMKAGNETWADIGKAIGRGKKEVQRRHKELTSNPSASNVVASNDANGTGNDGDNKITDGKNTSRDKKDGKSRGVASGPAHTTVTVASENDVPFALSQQQAIAFRKIYGDHYKVGNSSQKIKPDRNFNERDCEMLAMLAAKHRAERWLELQASFFNVTGRMVAVDVLKHKMASLVLEGNED